jgi:lambda repressor-like predicted transcriptional regulator
VAALAVVFGGGAGLAAAGSANPASSFLGDVAERLGISQGKLENAIEEATIARIDAAVAAGDLTKEQGDELKRRVRSGDAPSILPNFRGGPGLMFGRPGVPFMPGPETDLLDAAAGYLGMDADDVHQALHAGKSLADLAKDKGKSVDGLEQALRDAIREDADKAVDDGALTQEQADRMVEKLSGAVDELVNDAHRGLGFGLLRPRAVTVPPLEAMVPLPLRDLMRTAADYLGVDMADVDRALHDGKSLADLAQDKGKSVDGLEQALHDAIRKDADKAVDEGALTTEQADRLADKLGSTVDELVEGGVGLRFRIAPAHPVPAPWSSSPEPPLPMVGA